MLYHTVGDSGTKQSLQPKNVSSIFSVRPEGSSILAGATQSYGGDYPGRSVHERLTMFKFAVTILLLVPFNVSTTDTPFDNLNYNVSLFSLKA